MDKISGTFELPPTDQALRPAKKPKDTGKLSSLLLSLFTAILDPSNTDVPHSLDLDVTSAQAQEYYATGKEELKQLLRVSLVLLCSCFASDTDACAVLEGCARSLKCDRASDEDGARHFKDPLNEQVVCFFRPLLKPSIPLCCCANTLPLTRPIRTLERSCSFV